MRLRKFKSILVLVLALGLCLGLTGCSKKKRQKAPKKQVYEVDPNAYCLHPDKCPQNKKKRR